jgi:regulator of protease activity HflC (stomatin/prohibitin superfamily)
MSLVNPVTTTVVPISIRAHTYTMSNAETEGQVRGRDGIEAKTKDGQIVNCDVTLRYAVDPTKAATLYRDVGLEFVAKLVLPTIRSAVRDAAAQYPVDVVYSEKREELARALTATISARLAPRGLVVEEFLLRNISFTPEYAQAIESKQIEQQNAFRKQYELAVAAKEADRQRIAAEGDAQANDIRGGALRADPRVIQYEYLRKVAPNVKAVVLESGEVRSESFGKR